MGETKGILSEMWARIQEIERREALRPALMAEAIKRFADGNPTFEWGEFHAWMRACDSEGREIPLEEFKARRKDADAEVATIKFRRPEVK